MDEALDFPYRAEYAKSGRASCKKCKDPITKDSLRLAVMVQSPMFDGKVPNWYHQRCFFTMQKPKTVEDIGHYDCLRWQDQEKLKAQIESSTADSTKKSSSKKSKNTVKGKKPDFNMEMAKSARAACKDCEEKIIKGEVRISKLDYDSDKAKRFGPIPRWYHVDCFVKVRAELEFYGKGDTIPGFFTLGAEDKTSVRSKLPEIQCKRKIEDEPDSSIPAKKPRTEVDPRQKQNEKLFFYRDSLKKNVKKRVMTILLEHNNSYIPKGESKILDQLSDQMTFGTLASCSICTDGKFTYSYGSGYVCTGNISEWTACSHAIEDPARSPFKIPEELKEKNPFLAKYKYKNYGPRIVKKLKTSNSVSGSPSVSGTEKPLHGMKFVIQADDFTTDKQTLERRICELGGSVKARVTKDLAAVITTKDHVQFSKSTILEEAQERAIQCVPEEFLEEIEQGHALFMIKKMNMASWGSDPGTRISAAEATKSAKKESMYTKSMPEKLKIKLKGGVAVDPDSAMEDVCHVYQHGSRVYNCVLGYVDLTRGTNSYYKLQLLEGDKRRRWYVFRSWGRIGTTIGGNKIENMEDLQDAIKHFENLFEEKTANRFRAKEFVKVQGGWYPLELDYQQTKADVKLDLASSKSKLPNAVKNFVANIFDVNQMKSALVEYEIDLKKMPLGKLSRKQIEKAYKVLNDALSHLGPEDCKEDVKPIVIDKKPSSAVHAQLLDCSNRFYTLIPHDFGLKQPPLLNTHTIVKDKIVMLDNLSEIEIAYNLLNSDETDTKGLDQIDKHYKKLKTDMTVLDKQSEEYIMLKTYVENTHAATHSHFSLQLEEVFQVDRKGEKKRFRPFKKLPNRQLLWHGSRVTNYAGILSQGLRIAPPEAPVTGYMFGKGVYFADLVSKSANYCFTTKSNSTGYLMLCDVALGNMYEKTDAEFITRLPAGKHSAKGLGKTCPDPASDVTIEDGIKVPLGKPVNSQVKHSSLLYNEYIVYDVGQICSKYLLQVKFDHKI